MDDAELTRLRRTAASSGDYRDMLAYRAALKRSGNRMADLDVPLIRLMPRKQYHWEVVGVDRKESYGAVKQLLVELCREDGGFQPFIGRDARPLTFKETIQARIEQLRASGRKARLWDAGLYSCTAIVYEAGGRRFKIVPKHPDLLNAPLGRVAFLPGDFASAPGTPISIDNAFYNRQLEAGQVLSHPGWLAAVEGDVDLLREYVEIAFAKLGRSARLMPFFIPINVRESQLRSLGVGDAHFSYGCTGSSDLAYGIHFARLSPP